MMIESKATLHFLSGKMAAGKSTLAQQLAKEKNAVLLVEDHWLAQLYPNEITDISSYNKYAKRLKRVLKQHILQLLAHGHTVVLDFPANTVKQRNWFRELFEQAGVAHVLHYIDASNALCKQQLQERSESLPPGTAFTSAAEFDAITAYFTPPGEDEGFVVRTYQR